MGMFSGQNKKTEKSDVRYKTPISHTMTAKVIAFLLTLIMASVFAVSVVGVTLAFQLELYTRPIETVRKEQFSDISVSVAQYAATNIMRHQDTFEMKQLADYNVAGVTLETVGKDPGKWSYGDAKESAHQHGYSTTLYWDGQSAWKFYERDYVYDEDTAREMTELKVTVYVPDSLERYDDYYYADKLISFGYRMRYLPFLFGIVSLIGTIICFVFLMCSAGHRRGSPDVQPGWGTGIPVDLLSVVYLLAIFLTFQFAVESGYWADALVNIGLLTLAGVFAIAITLGMSMSIAVRLKLGKWWKNSIIYYVLRVTWVVIRKIGRALGRILGMLRQLPLVWKSMAIYFGVSVIEILIAFIFEMDFGIFLILWMLVRLLVMPFVVLYITLMLRKLQEGGKAIAEGDLSYQINTEHMLPEFKKHAENLNQIGEGMTLAVEQRLKSERMKTELITNVSHDIKTPLTSIINYSDLIEKEPTDNKKITEYAEVLHRQSDRLKRLIEDLVEASKASTGNLEVQMEPCEVGVMMSQTMGEYEQRLLSNQLQLMPEQPDQPVKIMADGRRLWRVFDNLMNNICKYALPGTRVYFTLEQTADQAVISFKNTSREPLNLTAEELTERFVRGDSARNSEGNGLGLSIAKSLTELQNGTMEVTTDGDLFKVVLRFPTI